jgi:NADH-quinone oxidoreductase subunit G
MPKVVIDGRTVEVDPGTNLIEAGQRIGVQIPHYCYHPRLSVVGQCRMCLVKIEGAPKLQTACTTQVFKDGMVVKVDDEEVKTAQQGMMEFFLINHPLDCPICDQAGECGLQDYSFKHGQAFSRFEYAEKRTYPGKERIPLGPKVLLNMNRCIQCTRCVRFTQEVSGGGELGFFQRGARAEIGVFPGKQLEGGLSSCVVDICPVGALTSTDFRFAERVWYLDKKPSVCTGCDVGCNVTIEHHKGAIRRYKPRFNPEVNDYWMCDYGRATFRRYEELERLTTPRVRGDGGEGRTASWREAMERLDQAVHDSNGTPIAVLASGSLTTEEAFLLARWSDYLQTPNRAVWREEGIERALPRPIGEIVGRETEPNRRGCELAGMVPGPEGMSAAELMEGEAAATCGFLLVADGDFGAAAHDPEVVARLRRAEFLAVIGWGVTPLTEVADVVLPVATHAEREGTFVNVASRLQRFEPAFPPPTGIRPALEVLIELISRREPSWSGMTASDVFARMAKTLPTLNGLAYRRIPAHGVALQADGAE